MRGPRVVASLVVLAALFSPGSASAGEQESAEYGQLIDLLRAPDSDSRWRAANALGELGPAAAEAAPELAVLIDDPDFFVRRHALRALARIGPQAPAVLPALLRASEHADAHLRYLAVDFLTDLARVSEKDRLAVARALSRATADSEADVRLSAAYGLGQVGLTTDQVVRALARTLKDPDAEVRSRAAMAISALDREAKIAALWDLAAALRDPDEAVRSIVCNSLMELGPAAEPVVPALIDVIREDASRTVRWKAVLALGAIGPGARRAVPALQELQGRTRVSDVDLSLDAARALRKIEGG